MILTGHEDIIAALERQLPPVCLFLGPHSVGKWTIAEEFRQRLGTWPADLMRVHSLTADSAREVVRFARTAPVGPKKVVIIQVDGAKPGPVNALLKTLEEPGDVQFFLIAERPVLATLASRAVTYRFGRLTKDQLVKVLIDKKGLREGEAAKFAAMAAGQVNEASRLVELSSPKAVVMIAVRALRDRDIAKLESVAREWDDDCMRLVGEWCYEALACRGRVFSSDEIDLGKIGRRIPLQVLVALTNDVRPTFFVRAFLSPLLRGA